MVWHKSRHIDQCKRIDSPAINPCIYGQLISDKEAKNIQGGKDNIFNKWFSENLTVMCTRMKLDHCNLKWIKGFNVGLKTSKLLEENISCKQFDLSDFPWICL